jgi:hypothetical protein
MEQWGDSIFWQPSLFSLCVIEHITLAAFPHVLDKRYFDQDSGHGIEIGGTLILDPHLRP